MKMKLEKKLKALNIALSELSLRAKPLMLHGPELQFQIYK